MVLSQLPNCLAHIQVVGSPPATPSALTYLAAGTTTLAASYTSIFDDTSPSGCGSVNACAIY